MPASPAFPWFKPPASPTAPQPPAQTQPAAAARAPDKFDPFQHALATGQVKPRPSRAKVEAGNRWTRRMLAPSQEPNSTQRLYDRAVPNSDD